MTDLLVVCEASRAHKSAGISQLVEPQVKTKLREAAKAVKNHMDGANLVMRKCYIFSFLTVTSIFLFLLTMFKLCVV